MTPDQLAAYHAWCAARDAWRAEDDRLDADKKRPAGIHPLDQAEYTAWQRLVDTYLAQAREAAQAELGPHVSEAVVRDWAENMAEYTRPE